MTHKSYDAPETDCCLHPCPVGECPEPKCLLEFKGGMIALEAYKRRLQIQDLAATGLSRTDIMAKLGLSESTVRRALQDSYALQHS